MGKRKNRYGNSPSFISPSKSAKQPKIEELFKQKKTVSKTKSSTPPAAAFDSFEWDFQTELEKQQLLDLSLSIRDELNENENISDSHYGFSEQLASSPNNLKGSKNKSKNRIQKNATQKKMFRQFCKQAPRTHLDQQICCLIDYYESQISQMRKELRKYKKEINHLQEEGKDEEEFLKNIDATANYRALLMSFQTQIIETKARNEQLVHENINLKKEMETRPTVQELKFYKHQVKKLEKTLKNIKSLESSEEENVKENRELKKSLGGSQLQEVCRRYLQVLSSIDSIIRSPRRAPLITLMQKKRLGKSCTQENEEESGFEHLPAVIEIWADQLMALKNLHQSLKKLVLQLVPWHSKAMQDTNECIRVEDLQLIVEGISEEVNNEEKKSHIPSQQTLYAVVCHFQKLFDVKTLNGIYPRMNEVYTKLGEMINAMRNLCDLLELDSSAPPSVLVNTVGKLCSLFNENVAWQVEQLLGTQDIESIIYKLEEYDDFFPAFHVLINNLLCVLEVRSLTDILPAVQKLKWKVQ